MNNKSLVLLGNETQTASTYFVQFYSSVFRKLLKFKGKQICAIVNIVIFACLVIKPECHIFCLQIEKQPRLFYCGRSYTSALFDPESGIMVFVCLFYFTGQRIAILNNSRLATFWQTERRQRPFSRSSNEFARLFHLNMIREMKLGRV